MDDRKRSLIGTRIPLVGDLCTNRATSFLTLYDSSGPGAVFRMSDVCVVLDCNLETNRTKIAFSRHGVLITGWVYTYHLARQQGMF